MDSTSFDILIAGGGLQAGLLVLALREHRPHARLALVEQDRRLGGNHTWCVHSRDLTPAQRRWCEPLFGHRWPGYTVEFPGRRRRVDQPYAAVLSDDFDRVVREALEEMPAAELFLGREVEEVGADRLRLDDGLVLRGDLVLDARGPASGTPPRAGFQKFVGRELELTEPHGLDRPLLMDARVEQLDGFRFLYLLPFSPTRLLVEDTRFSDGPHLDRAQLRTCIDDYLVERGWSVSEERREETGVLPMPWAGPDTDVAQRPLQVGTRGGWFHPATGYSFPVAARLAETVARNEANTLPEALGRLAREHDRQCRYARFLNRMLFRWYPPRNRRNIFERFYGMPESTIERFYALQTSFADQVRLLVGRPPRGLSPRFRFSSRRGES